MISARSRALVFLALGALAPSARAATREWTVFPMNGQWSNGDNWQGGDVPQPDDDLFFPGSYFDGILINDFGDGMAIRSITFDFPEYTLVGGSITFSRPTQPFNIGCTRAHAFGEGNTVAVPITIDGGLLLKAVPGCSLILSGEISGAGSLWAFGGGPVILSGNHSYTGPTQTSPEGGVLIVNGTLSGTSSVEVQASTGTSTLGGSGTFMAPLNAGSTLPGGFAVVAPGQDSGTGILSTGAATFGLNVRFVVKLNGTLVGAAYDQWSVTGGIDLGATTTLEVAFLGFEPPNGTTFTIVRNNTGTPITGAFAGLSEGALFVKNSTTFRISYVGGAGHDVVLTVVPTVATPATLAVDSGGNGVLEAGELAALQPTWTNTSGDSMSLTGVTANFIGPAGAVYDNPDALGGYGTIANGASAECTDCYSLQITAASRPAQHWDATIEETVSPASILKKWTLHVGQSFQDVPTSQPFYAFIENLFHGGVTAGCAGGNYCPEASVTRGQMAVFLLKGAHGSSYVPPACSSTVFTDEPCPGGPFVNWVNQLASEGITGGCGGGNYCPGDPVARGQMAVFLLKGEHGGSYVPPTCTATVFTDVPCPGAQFVDWINQLASEGVTGGCGGGNYCPADPVRRGDMAAFLVKAFGLVLYGP